MDHMAENEREKFVFDFWKIATFLAVIALVVSVAGIHKHESKGKLITTGKITLESLKTLEINPVLFHPDSMKTLDQVRAQVMTLTAILAITENKVNLDYIENEAYKKQLTQILNAYSKSTRILAYE